MHRSFCRLRGGAGAIAWFAAAMIGPASALAHGAITSALAAAGAVVAVAGSGNPVGPNLLANPSFEAGFTGGVAASWQSWTASGHGYCKQSSLLGRVGPGLYYNYHSPVTAAIAMKPKTILLMDEMLAYASTLRANLPDALIIGRRWIDNRYDTYMTDPEHYGVEFADEIVQNAAQYPAVNAWQGLNEPYPNDPTMFKKAARFEKAFADHLHQHGLKACVLNIAVGNPANMNDMLFQEVVDCLAVGDYVGYHAYGGAHDQLMNGPESPWYANRWRYYVDMYKQYGYRMPPVIYTECTTFNAWKGVFTAAQIRDDLNAFEAQSKYHDPWSVGMCIFLCGATPYWDGWEIANEPAIYDDCGAYNQAHPADAWDGLYSQQFGQSGTGGYSGGNVQVVNVQAGKTYRLEAAFKRETYGVGTDVTFYMGIDASGQTSNPNASTIKWSADLIADGARETDWWYTASVDRLAGGPRASVWFKASQPSGKPAFRISLDQVMFRALDLPIQNAPADFDRDGDADLTDFSFLQLCFNGPNRPLPYPECSGADLDRDADVDLADFAAFQACFNGPNRPVACDW